MSTFSAGSTDGIPLAFIFSTYVFLRRDKLVTFGSLGITLMIRVCGGIFG